MGQEAERDEGGMMGKVLRCEIDANMWFSFLVVCAGLGTYARGLECDSVGNVDVETVNACWYLKL